MLPRKKNRTIYRGDDAEISVALPAGLDAADITDWRMQARDAAGGLLLDIAGGALTDDTLTLPIPGAATDGRAAGVYDFDVELMLASGERLTIESGRLAVVADVTSDALPADIAPLPHGYHVAPDVYAALEAANAPGATNPFATMGDVGEGGPGGGASDIGALGAAGWSAGASPRWDGSEFVAVTLAEAAALAALSAAHDALATAYATHNHDTRYYTESEINTILDAILAEIDAVTTYATQAALQAVDDALAALTPGDIGAEPALGAPPANGYVLASTAAGVRSWVEMAAGGGGGVTDHGALTGLADNDHPQYALLAAANTFAAGQVVSDGTDSITLTTSGGRPRINFNNPGQASLNLEADYDAALGDAALYVNGGLVLTGGIITPAAFSAPQIAATSATLPRVRLTKSGVQFFDISAATNDYLKILDGGAAALVSINQPDRRWEFGASVLELDEMSAPGAPGANKARLFVRDTGGKSELCVRFATGAIQIIATEP